MTIPVTKERASLPWKNFLPPEKISWVYCIQLYITIVFVHAVDVKFGLLQKTIRPPGVPGWLPVCCLVTSVSYSTQLSLFAIKFFRLNIKFNRRN